MANISVITVCRNANESIKKTIDSITSQSVAPYEYIVVDGCSTDGTLLHFQSFSVAPIKVVSEKDRGIYDAMNKAVLMCSGDYVYFLNAGDVFSDSRVIEDISRLADELSQPSLLFGNVVYVWEKLSGKRHFAHVNALTLPACDLCHQAVFAKRKLFQEVGYFDLSYKLAADFDWLLRVFRSGFRQAYIDRDIAFYDGNGVSSSNASEVEIEKSTIVKRHYSIFYLYTAKFIFRFARKFFGIGKLKSI